MESESPKNKKSEDSIDLIIDKIKDYTIIGMRKNGITKQLIKVYSVDDVIKAWKQYEGNHKNEKEDDNLYSEVVKATKDYIKKHDTILTLDNDEALIFVDGYYHLNGEKLIHNELLRFFEEHGDEVDFSAEKILEIIKGTVLYIERDDFKEPIDKINVKNGVLDLTTMELESHNSKYKFLHKYEWDYVKGADCPKIKKFLKESVSSNEDFLCLQEYIGFCLYPDYLFDVFLVLFGKTGHNHKSKTASLIRIFLGSELVSSVAPEDLQKSKFAASYMFGKKANISSEISRKVSLGYELKKLLGHDVIHAEKKFKGAFEFHNRAKIIFTWNEIPEVNSPFYDAFWNKPIILEFNKSFEGEDSQKVMKEITSPEEMSGFLNFAIEGLKRLITKNGFTYNKDFNYERWNKYRDIKNPVIDFFKDCIIFNINESISKSELHELYEKYCKINSITPETKKSFGMYVKDMSEFKNDRIKEKQKLLDNKHIEVWEGITINKSNIERIINENNDNSTPVNEEDMDLSTIMDMRLKSNKFIK